LLKFAPWIVDKKRAIVTAPFSGTGDGDAELVIVVDLVLVTEKDAR